MDQMKKQNANDILDMLRKNNFRGSSVLTGESINFRESLGPLIRGGFQRQKQGVLKEHAQLRLYREGSKDPNALNSLTAADDFDESGFIPLGNKSGNGQAKTILENPQYKKSPFYPFADEVKKKQAQTSKSN